MFYKIIVFIVRVFLFFVFRIKIEGKENIPKQGGAMLALNHKSYWDPVMAAVCCPRRLRFMAKAELFRNKLFGGLISALGAFPVHRGKGDIAAIKSSLAILKNDELMLIFPEGGRVLDERNSEAKPGAVMLAIKARVPIIPAYISGKYRWFSKLTVTFGKPVYYDNYYNEKPVVQELQSLSNSLLSIMRSYKEERK